MYIFQLSKESIHMHIEIDRVIMDDELKTRFSERRESEEYYKGVITDVEPIAVEGKKTSEYSCSSYQLKEKQYYFSTFRNVEIIIQFIKQIICTHSKFLGYLSQTFLGNNRCLWYFAID